MKFPIIGMTTYQAANNEGVPITALQSAYIDSLVQAGGVPILVPARLKDNTFHALYNHLDGIFFTGGGDIAVDRYGGLPHPQVENVDVERDSFELTLLKSLVQDGKPFLGVCRGFQMVIIGLGGSLYAHIKDQMPNALKHDYYPGYPRTYLAHKVLVDGGTKLAKILGKTDLSVNSLHHQGAKYVPPALNPVAFAPDGLVEAVELPDHPYGIAVQWHPEWLTGLPSMRRLFSSFVEAARGK